MRQAGQRDHAKLFRTKQQAWIFAVGGTLLVMLFLVYVVKEIGRHDVAAGRRLLVVAVFGALALFSGWAVLWRSVRAGVLLNGAGVTVRNVWRSRRLRCEEVDRFSVESYGVWTGGCVHLRDGTSIRTWGIQGQNPALFPNSQWAEGPIEELNALLRDARNSGNSTPGHVDIGTGRPTLQSRRH
jgi:hypothetical protein